MIVTLQIACWGGLLYWTRFDLSVTWSIASIQVWLIQSYRATSGLSSRNPQDWHAYRSVGANSILNVLYSSAALHQVWWWEPLLWFHNYHWHGIVTIVWSIKTSQIIHVDLFHHGWPSHPETLRHCSCTQTKHQTIISATNPGVAILIHMWCKA